MKALAVFPQSRQIRMISVPEPRLDSPDLVLIHPLEVGICGTDRDIARFEIGTPPPGSDHLVIGHEMLGEVVEVGKDVTDFRKGDLVVPTVRRPCADSWCMPCRTEQSDMCLTGRFTERGIWSASGYMTELIVESAPFLTRIPVHLREVGVLLEPLSIIEKSLAAMAQMRNRIHGAQPGGAPSGRPGAGTALVLGAGPIGFLGALSLHSSGFRTYVASRNEPEDPKVRVLAQAGIGYFCTLCCSPREIAAAIGDPDLILEAAGSSDLCLDYMPVLGTNGLYIMTGTPGPCNLLTLDADQFMRQIICKNQVILGVVNANVGAFRSGVQRLARFCENYPEVMQSLVTARTPIEGFSHHLAQKQRGEIKVALTL
jgi:threonine dehydrogenase-like Zn-dependent dehydrogenase